MFALVNHAWVERRFWWLWPTQVIWLAWALECLLDATTALARWTRRLVVIALIAGMAANPLLIGKVKDWIAHGWSGMDDPRIQAVEAIGRANKLAASLKIGYQTLFPPWFVWLGNKDPAYKVGTDLDLQLRDHFRIRNDQTCLEGFSPNDLYRIVQTKPLSRDEDRGTYRDVVGPTSTACR